VVRLQPEQLTCVRFGSFGGPNFWKNAPVGLYGMAHLTPKYQAFTHTLSASHSSRTSIYDSGTGEMTALDDQMFHLYQYYPAFHYITQSPVGEAL